MIIRELFEKETGMRLCFDLNEAIYFQDYSKWLETRLNKAESILKWYGDESNYDTSNSLEFQNEVYKDNGHKARDYFKHTKE